MIPVLYKREEGGKQERWNETTFMDLIRPNKKGLCHRRFCSVQCFKIWPDCLNFKHWPILSRASGALLIFTVKSTLNYTRVLRQSTKKTKTKKQSIIPRSDAVVCDIYQDVHGLGINLSNLGPTNRVDRNKKEEEENGCVQAVHSFITLSKATFDLLDMPTAPGCFAVSVYSHVSHKRINYQTTDDSC